jgi:hypothetical protein
LAPAARSLGSLDVIYAHKAMATLLSTRLPSGVDVPRGYDDRGWTNFERAEAQLIKPDTLCIDIGLFTVDKACEAYEGDFTKVTPLRIGGARFAERTVAQLARQGSYLDSTSDARGLLGTLTRHGRSPPLAPGAFAALLGTKAFTNGADAATVVELYSETATALLGSAREIEYTQLEWTAADFARLGEALPYCGALEKLRLIRVGIDDAGAAAVLAGLASLPSVKTLDLITCKAVTAIPGVAAVVSLERLFLGGCASLTALPDLSALASLKKLHLQGCTSLRALPEQKVIERLEEFEPPYHLEALMYEGGGESGERVGRMTDSSGE